MGTILPTAALALPAGNKAQKREDDEPTRDASHDVTPSNVFGATNTMVRGAKIGPIDGV
jgi:hypothetical protein